MIDLDKLTDFEKARAYERVVLKARETNRDFAQKRAAKLQALEDAAAEQGWDVDEWMERQREDEAMAPCERDTEMG